MKGKIKGKGDRLDDYVARDKPQLSKHGCRLYPTDNIETIEMMYKVA